MSTRCNTLPTFTVVNNALCGQFVKRLNAMQTRIGIIMVKPLSRTQLVPNDLDSNWSAFVMYRARKEAKIKAISSDTRRLKCCTTSPHHI